MNKVQLKRKFLDVFNGMNKSERVAIYQDGCEHFFGYEREMLFPMGEFDEREGNQRPLSEVYRNLTETFINIGLKITVSTLTILGDNS